MSSASSERPPLDQAGPVKVMRILNEASVAVLVSGFAALICLQVFYRYVLNASLVWTEEVVRYGLLWAVMLGASLATDRNAHIALEPLRALLSTKAYRRVRVLAGALIVLFCAITAWYGWEYTSRLWHMRSPAAHIPMPFVFIAIPVGCVMIAFFTVVHLISDSHHKTTNKTEGHVA